MTIIRKLTIMTKRRTKDNHGNKDWRTSITLVAAVPAGTALQRPTPVYEARLGRVVVEGEAGEEGGEEIQYPVWIVAPDAPRIPP